MKIVVAHERYMRAGGEDEVFETETAMLESRGHEVIRFEEDNERIGEMSKILVAAGTTWNPAARREIGELVRRERPDLVHFHNTFPLLSPAVYHAVAAEGIPVVQTLHNFRLICPKAQLFREGEPCEDCVGRRVAWPGVLHACYRDSRVGTAAVAAMLATHRAIGTYSDTVTRYIVLTEFAKRKFVEGGLPAERLAVRPNFLAPDPGPGDHSGEHALFVGRLSEEKGIDDLLDAWDRLGERIPLHVIGEGPLSDRVAAAARSGGIVWHGRLKRQAVIGKMRDARFLVFPSRWYEGYPLVIVEAFATGMPVLASDLGAMRSMVSDRETGLRFRPGDPDALVRAVEWMLDHPAETNRMGERARATYLEHYTEERAYERLIEIYEEARASVAGSNRRPASASVR